MFFSGDLIPSYILMKWLNLIDSRLALIIRGMFNVFNKVKTIITEEGTCADKPEYPIKAVREIISR